MDANHAFSRRNFIKGIIATGAVATSASYLFRGNGAVIGQSSPPGAAERLLTLAVNGQQRRVDVMKQDYDKILTALSRGAEYLRDPVRRGSWQTS